MLSSSFEYPNLKPFIEYCWKNGVISFFKIPGISIDIKDEDKFIFSLCRVMDGVLSTNQLVQEMSVHYPSKAGFIGDLLSTLNRELLIEDLSVLGSSELSVYEKDRFSRNIEFFGAYCDATEDKYNIQQKLSSLKVVILGLGGVGSSVLRNLLSLGVKKYKIIDFDVVEVSNLNRQMVYMNDDVGRLKSEAAKERALDFYPEAEIDALNIKINDISQLNDVISDQDILISAADSPRKEILNWVNASCVKYNIPYICGGIDSQWITYYSIIPGVSGCMQCWLDEAANDGLLFQKLLEEENFIPSINANVAIMPMISILSGLMANELIHITTQIGKPKALGSVRAYDFSTSNFLKKECWSKNKNCHVCGALN